MKKILLIILAVLMFGKINTVYAQTPTPRIALPGVSCGNAEATEPTSIKCCQEIDVSTPTIPSALQSIEFINKIVQIISLLKRSQNIVPCVIGYPSDTSDLNNCTCLKESQITPTPIEAVKNLCDKYISSDEKSTCETCGNSGGIWTALGCIPGDFSSFVSEFLLSWGVGLAGIIAMICIIFSVFQLQSSRGNPEKIKKAQELLISCIMGLMLIVFSVFILRLIGVDILKIPGFGG